MNRLSLLSLAVFHCLGAGTAFGDIIIDVQNSTMSAGSNSFVDVWLTGDPGDTLEEFGYQFAITGATPQSGDLQFSVVQSASEVSEIGPPAYVFLGDSGSFNADRVGGDPVLLGGGDILATQQDLSVNDTFLLARLELTHVGSLINPSHQFTISLVPGASYFDMDADTPGVQPLAFSALSGTVTVTSAAVPEPSSIFALGLMTAAGGCVRRWRRKSSSITPEARF